ncbi:MAG: DUF4386 domain-containing protein [Dehalococcoidales bacterium]
MNSNRKTAIIVGVLYIIGTVAGVLSLVFVNPILSAPDYLLQFSANKTQVITGALFVIIMGVALVMVPVMMFPILKKQSKTLALGYVVFRALEAVTYIAVVISWLLLITLSQEFVKAGAPAVSYFQTSGALLLEAENWINPILDIVFILGALMFYYLLYQSKLIPRFISVWGLIAATPYLAAGLLSMFGLISPMSTTQIVMVVPLALQEMVLAVWLIVKGFNSSAIASLSTKTDIN